MKKIKILIIIIISLLSASLAIASQPGTKGLPKVKVIRASEIIQKEQNIISYEIDAGDLLTITVSPAKELERELWVRSDGMITFPLIGDVPAAGYTIDELRTDLTEKLKKYVKKPEVSIMVKSFGGKKVVVLGEVIRPGLIRFTEPIRIMEALALSGGYNESAGLKSVLVIKGDVNSPEYEVIVVNATAILKGRLEENIYLENNDIIFIPRNFVGNVSYFIRQISPLLGAATTYYNIKKTQYMFEHRAYMRGTGTVDYEDRILRDDTKIEVYDGSLE